MLEQLEEASEHTDNAEEAFPVFAAAAIAVIAHLRENVGQLVEVLYDLLIVEGVLGTVLGLSARGLGISHGACIRGRLVLEIETLPLKEKN